MKVFAEVMIIPSILLLGFFSAGLLTMLRASGKAIKAKNKSEVKEYSEAFFGILIFWVLCFIVLAACAQVIWG